MTLSRANIDSLGFRGEGVARVDGKVVFVPGAFPGEEVDLEDYEVGKKFDRATLGAIHVPSPHRRETPCAHDHRGGCGGCALLSATPAATARWKTQILQERLERKELPGRALQAPGVLGDGLGYRNHVSFLVARRGRLAFATRKDRTPDSKPRTLIEHCPVLHPLVDEVRAALSGRCSGLDAVEIRAGLNTGERAVILHGTHLPTRLDPVEFPDLTFIGLDDKGYLPIKGLPWIHEELEGQRFRISPASVFPVSTDGAALLVKEARRLAEPETSELCWNPSAGVGLFALLAARGSKSCYAFETDPFALPDLKVNVGEREDIALRNQRDGEAQRDLLAIGERPDLILSQVPSGGHDEATIQGFLDSGAKRIVLHHWDGNDLLQDLDRLRPRYRADTIKPLDLAPGTMRLDTLTRFALEEGEATED